MASVGQAAGRKSKRKQDLAAFSRRGDVDFDVESVSSSPSKRLVAAKNRRRHGECDPSRSPQSKRRCQPKARTDSLAHSQTGPGTGAMTGTLGEDSSPDLARQGPRLREPIREEQFTLRWRPADSLFESVPIESVFSQLSELAEKKAGSSSRAQTDLQFVADQPPCLESIAIHSPVLVRLQVGDGGNPTYGLAQVLSTTGEAHDWRATVRLIPANGESSPQAEIRRDVMPDDLRMYAPLSKIEVSLWSSLIMEFVTYFSCSVRFNHGSLSAWAHIGSPPFSNSSSHFMVQSCISNNFYCVYVRVTR